MIVSRKGALRRPAVLGVAACAVAAAFVIPPARVAAGAGCTTDPVVTSLGAVAVGGLRDAVTNACAGSTITFAVTGTIDLGGNFVTVAHDMTIQGPGAGL